MKTVPDPYLYATVHAIIFFIIIFELMPNYYLKSSSVRVPKQLPSMPKFSKMMRGLRNFYARDCKPANYTHSCVSATVQVDVGFGKISASF